MNAIPILFAEPWAERLGWTLVHFLWQGMAIAGLYAAARSSSRRASPHWRYVLACAALAAMMAAPIVTYSLLNSPVSVAATSSHARAEKPPNSDSGTTFVTSGEAAWMTGRIGGAQPGRVLSFVVMLWLAGTLVFWLRLAGAWMAAARLSRQFTRAASGEWQQALHRLQTRVRVWPPVRLLVSGLVETPVVAGWLRPVILVPVGALAGLPAEHLEAILLHELAHIRRHDNLVNMLQNVAEALLFYHPATWWISGHIRIERELCCDDVAVAATGDAFTYATALATLEAYRPAHARSVMAANGGRLADRIARVLGQARPEPRVFSTPGAAIAVLLAITAYVLFGQTSERPKFEAATVKPIKESMRSSAGMRPTPGGRLRAENMPVRMLIMRAYQLQDFQIAGGPDWLRNEGFDIEARGDSQATKEQLMLMLQSLIEERFQLRYHRETREGSVFALSVAKNGPKLPTPKEGGCVNPDDPAPSNSRADRPCGRLYMTMKPSGMVALGGAVAMPEFIQTLSSTLGRPVLDRTGITAKFDVSLEFASDDTVASFFSLWGSVAGHREAMAAAAPPGSAGAAPNIIVALREQLGLKLDSTKGPVEVMVIDHVEKPGAN